MANSARIDELQKKFDENPRRYFAPLANEYRKGGDPDQAIAICREFLPQQPGHMSGHIVYGQALFDAQQFDEARTVFDTALTLDPENLIALRQLGDIARTLHENDVALSWYQRVLAADPRNTEIASILAELATGGGAASAPVPVVAPESFAPPELSAPPESSLPTVEQPPVQEHPVTEVVEAVRFAPPADVEPPAATAPPSDELLDIDDLLLEHDAAVVPRVSTPRMSLQAMGVEIERSDDETFIPDTSDPEPAINALSSVDSIIEEPVVEQTPVIPALAVEEFSFDEFSTPDTPAPPPAAAADPFATETMAELYLKQGHVADALRVYRLLLDARPSDAGLRARVAELEAQGESEVVATPASVAALEPWPEPVPEAVVANGPSIREFLSALATRRPSPAPAQYAQAVEEPAPIAPVEVFVARTPIDPPPSVSSGGSIDALFGGAGVSFEDQDAAATLAGAYGAVDSGPDEAPPGQTSPDNSMSGAPARRATEELSLDSVFREPAGERAPNSAGFSFDRFFSGGKSEGEAAGPDALPHRGPTGSPDDDIEQFNSWLDGLKKR